MKKFESILTATGDNVLKKRAQNLTEATLETFRDEKRELEKRVRELKNEVDNMEDLSVKTTQSLVVGENLDTNRWVKRRIDIALELRDLQIEIETVEKLIAEYFEADVEE